MMSYFRLFAGLTSLSSKRWLLHFSSIGPAGILAFSSIGEPSQLHHSGEHRERERYIAGNDDERECPGAATSPAPEPVTLRAERLQHAPRSEEHTSELQSPCNLVCR